MHGAALKKVILKPVVGHGRPFVQIGDFEAEALAPVVGRLGGAETWGFENDGSLFDPARYVERLFPLVFGALQALLAELTKGYEPKPLPPSRPPTDFDLRCDQLVRERVPLLVGVG